MSCPSVTLSDNPGDPALALASPVTVNCDTLHVKCWQQWISEAADIGKQQMAVIRRELRIARLPDEVWPSIGDPAALPGWFPGIAHAEVDGCVRVITANSGISLPEEIMTNDPVRRIFQYRITAPLVSDHLGTIEVTDSGDGCSLVSYETRCEPDMIALVIGGACGNALHELRRQLEATAAPAATRNAAPAIREET